MKTMFVAAGAALAFVSTSVTASSQAPISAAPDQARADLGDTTAKPSPRPGPASISTSDPINLPTSTDRAGMQRLGPDLVAPLLAPLAPVVASMNGALLEPLDKATAPITQAVRPLTDPIKLPPPASGPIPAASDAR